MTHDEAVAAVRAAITAVAPEVDLTLVDPTASLREAVDLDSLDFLAVIENVASATGVSVPERDYATVDSLDGFIAYLQDARTQSGG